MTASSHEMHSRSSAPRLPGMGRSPQIVALRIRSAQRDGRPDDGAVVRRQRERQALRGSLRAVASTADCCEAREVEDCQRSGCETGAPRIPARRSPRSAVSERVRGLQSPVRGATVAAAGHATAIGSQPAPAAGSGTGARRARRRPVPLPAVEPVRRRALIRAQKHAPGVPPRVTVCGGATDRTRRHPSTA